MAQGIFKVSKKILLRALGIFKSLGSEQEYYLHFSWYFRIFKQVEYSN